MFLEKELRSHNSNFYIHVSVSGLYIPTIDLPTVNMWPDPGNLKNAHRYSTWMWELRLRPCNSQKWNTLMRFLVQCVKTSKRGVFTGLSVECLWLFPHSKGFYTLSQTSNLPVPNLWIQPFIYTKIQFNSCSSHK